MTGLVVKCDIPGPKYPLVQDHSFIYSCFKKLLFLLHSNSQPILIQKKLYCGANFIFTLFSLQCKENNKNIFLRKNTFESRIFLVNLTCPSDPNSNILVLKCGLQSNCVQNWVQDQECVVIRVISSTRLQYYQAEVERKFYPVKSAALNRMQKRLISAA